MRKTPHILIMSSWYPTKSNPFLGNFVKRHAELIATKYPVTVLNIERNLSISKLSIEINKTGNLTEVLVEYPGSSNPILKFFRARKAFEIGVKHIQNVDLIHVSNILSKGYQFLWAKKHFERPMIITEHGSYYRTEVSSKWTFKEKHIIRNNFKKAAMVTAVSPFLKSEIEHVFPKLNIQILPNVVDHLIFESKDKIASSKVKFIHISTLDEDFKNISGIIDACEVLSREMNSNQFELQVISDEPYQKWQKLVSDKNLEDFIQFSGPLQSIEIAAKIQQSDALILFSNYETFSCVIAEAWATGTPVISTPVGIAKNLDKEVGILVEIQNVTSLVKAMKQVVNQEISFNNSKIQSKSKEYSSELVLKQVDYLYLQVLNA